ncbi:MAG: AmmeMemoRadiSam system protein B [Elusimicrobia bacterium]|nr:AmmeMemoRadiSam system protein B [Elusimicrobiota bacterium]
MTSDIDALPALRQDLEIVPFEHEGRPLFLLQDPESGARETMGLSPAGMAVASLLDGRRRVEDVLSALKEAAGLTLAAQDVARIAQQLEQAGLLETEAVRERRRRILREFAESSVRKAVLSGASYPGDSLELAKLFGGFARDGRGPGKPFPDKPGNGAAPLGLMAPHIDFHRGGPAYAWAYQALADSEPPDLVVALGVAHASPPSPWIMTKKAYETPWGPMEVDKALYKEIADTLWYDPLADEWAHRKEHSLEFQAVWLRFLWRERTPPWVPILCSTFERWANDRSPATIRTVEDALNRIGERLRRRGKTQRVLVLAGVDLAHVGPRFGDEIELTPELEKRIETEDRKSLAHAMALEADPFYLSVVADGHWRKVCGLSATYTALRWLKAMGAEKGSLLAYGQAPDPAGGIVSFTSAVFR